MEETGTREAHELAPKIFAVTDTNGNKHAFDLLLISGISLISISQIEEKPRFWTRIYLCGGGVITLHSSIYDDLFTAWLGARGLKYK